MKNNIELELKKENWQTNKFIKALKHKKIKPKFWFINVDNKCIEL